jgi:hypothetical protein
MELTARLSGAGLPGTWGFGFWNDPAGLGMSSCTDSFRLPAPPQAAWFFSASERSYLSLRDDLAANGFFVQSIRTQPFGPALPAAMLVLPFSHLGSREMLRRQVGEAASPVKSATTDWQCYEIRWDVDSICFWADGQLILRTELLPLAPLGAVIWIDNQYARFDPRGKIAWGLEPNSAAAWLDVRDLRVERSAP